MIFIKSKLTVLNVLWLLGSFCAKATDVKQDPKILEAKTSGKQSGNPGAIAAALVTDTVSDQAAKIIDPLISDDFATIPDLKVRGDPHYMHPMFPQFPVDPNEAIRQTPPKDASAKDDHIIKHHRSFLTQCRGFEALTGQDGKIVNFRTHCHVEIWNGKVQPDWKLPQTSSVKVESPEANGTAQKQQNANQFYEPQPLPRRTWRDILALPQMRGLELEAAKKHHDCMALKQSAAQKVRDELPKTVTNVDDILAAVKALLQQQQQQANAVPSFGALSAPHLTETMIHHLAHIHALEKMNSKDGGSNATERLKEHLLGLNQSIDRHCQASHPIISRHRITYFPDERTKNMGVTFIIKHPSQDSQLMAGGSSSDANFHANNYFQAMADAAAHHYATQIENGAVPQQGRHKFEVYHHPLPDPATEMALRKLTLANHLALHEHVSVPRLIFVRHVNAQTTQDGDSLTPTKTETDSMIADMNAAKAASINMKITAAPVDPVKLPDGPIVGVAVGDTATAASDRVEPASSPPTLAKEGNFIQPAAK